MYILYICITMKCHLSYPCLFSFFFCAEDSAVHINLQTYYFILMATEMLWITLYHALRMCCCYLLCLNLLRDELLCQLCLELSYCKHSLVWNMFFFHPEYCFWRELLLFKSNFECYESIKNHLRVKAEIWKCAIKTKCFCNLTGQTFYCYSFFHVSTSFMHFCCISSWSSDILPPPHLYS